MLHDYFSCLSVSVVSRILAAHLLLLKKMLGSNWERRSCDNKLSSVDPMTASVKTAAVHTIQQYGSSQTELHLLPTSEMRGIQDSDLQAARDVEQLDKNTSGKTAGF